MHFQQNSISSPKSALWEKKILLQCIWSSPRPYFFSLPVNSHCLARPENGNHFVLTHSIPRMQNKKACRTIKTRFFFTFVPSLFNTLRIHRNPETLLIQNIRYQHKVNDSRSKYEKCAMHEELIGHSRLFST